MKLALSIGLISILSCVLCGSGPTTDLQNIEVEKVTRLVMTSGLMNLTSEVLNELEATNLRVKNGSLTLSQKVSNETLLDIESLLDKRLEQRRELGLSIDEKPTGADYAAIGAKSSIAGVAFGAFGAIAQFIISIINLCDSKKTKIESDNGCYYRVYAIGEIQSALNLFSHFNSICTVNKYN